MISVVTEGHECVVSGAERVHQVPAHGEGPDAEQLGAEWGHLYRGHRRGGRSEWPLHIRPAGAALLEIEFVYLSI